MVLKLLPILLMLGWAWYTMHSSEKGLLRDLDRKSTPLDSGPLLSALQRFRGAMGVSDIRVAIYEQEAINGLAAPDGRIVLTRGLFERYRRGEFTASELAAVIAHEIGHVALGHIDRRKKAWRVEMAAKAAANLRAMPAPKPDAAPVTMAVLPSSLMTRPGLRWPARRRRCASRSADGWPARRWAPPARPCGPASPAA